MVGACRYGVFAAIGIVSAAAAVPGAMASEILWNPAATNGNASLVLDASASTFTSGQGTALVYENLTTNRAEGTKGNTVFNAELTIAIGSFLDSGGTTIGGTGIGSDWQLFITMHINGTGTWGGGTTFTVGALDVSNSKYTMWAAQGGSADVAFGTPGASTGVALSDFSAAGFNVTGTPVDSGCFPMTPGSNCVRVGVGTILSGSLTLSDVDGENFNEVLAITSLLDPGGAAEGTGKNQGGLIDEPQGFDFGLNLNSGSVLGQATDFEVVDDPQNFTTPTGQPMNWDLVDVVPEPATLAIFGTALIAGAGMRRRRRRS